MWFAIAQNALKSAFVLVTKEEGLRMNSGNYQYDKIPIQQDLRCLTHVGGTKIDDIFTH